MQSYLTQPPATVYYPSQPAAIHGAPQPTQPQGFQPQQPLYVQGAAPPVQYVQPNVVLPNAVTQPQGVHIIAQPAATPTGYDKYKAKQSIILGRIQIAVGVFSIILNAIGIGLQSKFYDVQRRYNGYYTDENIMYYICYGMWCSVLYILAGSFAIAAGKKKTKCPVIASFVLSVIAAVFVWNQIIMAAVSVDIDAGTRRRFYNDYYYDGSHWMLLPAADWRLVQGSLAVGCFLLILGLLEFVATVWCSVLGCRVACCCKSTSPYYVAGSQQVLYINSGGQLVPQAGNVATYSGQYVAVGSVAAYPSQPVALGAVSAYPSPPGAVGAMAPTSAPPYVQQTMIPNGEKSAEMAGQEAPPSYDNP